MEAFVTLAEHAVVCCAVGVAAIVDLRTRTIPNACPLAIAITHAVTVGIAAVGGANLTELVVSSLAGVFAVSLPLVAVALFTGGVGGGDVKLFAALGLTLGWWRVLVVLLCSCAFTALAGLVIHLMRRQSKMQSCLFATTVPMAPQIALALAITFWCFPM